MLLEESTPEFWKNKIIAGKSVIHLADQQTLLTAIREGNYNGGKDYIAQRIRKIRERSGLMEYVMIDLGESLWLVLKIVDTAIDVRVYEEVDTDAFSPGNRADMIRNERYWLFQAPESENFNYNELLYTYSMNHAMEVEGQETEFEYDQKGQGEIYGECTTVPPEVGLPQKMMAVVVEYQSTVDNANPEIMVVEIGGENADEGGLISMMIGANIRPSEIDVY